MGFNHQVSQACGRCRNRRMKCDKGRPSCRQCKSARVSCPGYRHADSFSPFIDETKGVVQRCKIQENAALPALTEHHETTIGPGLQTQVVDVARNFFLDRLLDGSQFYYIPQMCDDTAPSESRLFHHAVESLALASFSNEKRDPAVLTRAYASYALSLQKLQSSLEQEPLDATLASILLLSQFEARLPCSDPKAIYTCWAHHTKGAYALLQEHEHELDLSSPRTRALASHILNALNLFYTDTSERKSEHLLGMTHKLLESSPRGSTDFQDQMRLRLHEATDSLNDLRRDTEGENPTEPLFALQKSLRVERAILSMQALLAQKADFRTYAGDEAIERRGFENAALYRGGFHVYKTTQDIRLWNNVRMLRLTVLERRYGVLEHLRDSEVGDAAPSDAVRDTRESALEQLWHDTRNSMIELVDDICASVVQPLRTGSSDCTTGAASQLVWPLYICGRVAPVRCLDFVEDRLEWMAKRLKIHGAKLALGRLRELEYEDDFMHVCHTF